MAAEFHPQAQADFVAPGAKLEAVWTEGEFTEGPAADPMTGAIYFTDIGDSILRFAPTSGKVDVFRSPSGRANGMMFDARRRLCVCEGANTGGGRRVSAIDLKGRVEVLADNFEGKRFNSPNDLFVDSKNRVWFSDPRYVGDEPRELDFQGVFVIDSAGTLKLATKEVSTPNGILVSPDLNTLYVADSSGDPQGNHHLVAFSIRSDGSLGPKKVLFDFGPERRGIDGMTLDREGNIYATAGKGELSGIYVFGPEGEQLAFIPTPGPPTNCEFGVSNEARMLYITGGLGDEHPADGKGSHGLFRIPVLKSAYRGHPPAIH